jgi:nucleotide-binding universal stress UspA family protein
MNTVQSPMMVRLKNVLYLTDFSGPSEAALPFAAALGRKYGAKVHALHVLVPHVSGQSSPVFGAIGVEAEEDTARGEIRRVDSQLIGLDHEAIVERGPGVWPIVARAIQERRIDVLVVGTQGRGGAQRFVLGSVAEEIFRCSPVPVLTIGPAVRSGSHDGARFGRILFVTDFTPDAASAIPYAVSLARENDARLILAHVMPYPDPNKEGGRFEMSVAEVIHHLYETVPKDANLPLLPGVAVEFGETSERIVKVAKERNAHLIVVGIRSARGRVDAATHFGRGIAHQVVACSPCPVLTVRE